MRLEGSTGRQHGVVDVVILLATVFLALATWLYLSDAASIPFWKSYISVAITVLFALAALTRHPRWAIAIRGLTGAWIIAAPHLLTFSDVEPALYAYLTIGTLVTAMSIPGLIARQFSFSEGKPLFSPSSSGLTWHSARFPAAFCGAWITSGHDDDGNISPEPAK